MNCASPKYRRKDERKVIPLDSCLDCAQSRGNDCQFTYEMLSSMFESQQDRQERISTTTLTAKCFRSQYLERTREFSSDPEKLWPAFRGTLLHGQLENHARPSSIEEARFHVDIPDLGPLSGSPDLLDPDLGILYDYKVTKEVPRFNYPWGDHVAQLNVNRWLVDNATKVEWRGNTYEGDGLKQFRPDEWNALIVVYIDDKGPKPLECTKSVDVPKKDGNGTKKARVPDIWSDEFTFNWIRTRYKEVREAFDSGVVPAIPKDFEGWQHPLCGFCSQKAECISLHFNQEAH